MFALSKQWNSARQAGSTFEIMVFPGAHNLPLWWMEANSFSGSPLHILPTTSRDEQIASLADGRVDFICTAPDNLLSPDAREFCPLVVGSIGELSLVATPQVSTLRRLAVDNPRSGYAGLAYEGMTKIGFLDKDYDIYPVGGTLQRYRAMANGDATLGLLHSPFTELAERAGWSILHVVEEKFPSLVVACRETDLGSDRVDQFVDAYKLALHSLSHNPPLTKLRDLFARHLTDLEEDVRELVLQRTLANYQELQPDVASDLLPNLQLRREQTRWPDCAVVNG
jgi:hypothetical protein